VDRRTGGLLYSLDAALAALGGGFMRAWSRVELLYRRPTSRLALRLKFAFYPLLALCAIAWLGWDWSGPRSLDGAENAIFDRVLQWRPHEPLPSGRVVVVEIDECSIDYFRSHGGGGWPWSRQRHADLLERLDRAGVAAVGYDVLFADPSREDPAGDQALEAMASGGAGRFLFAASRLHPEYDAASPLRASQGPGAFALRDGAGNDPAVALLLPYGTSMARYSGIVNVSRSDDGILRDIPLYEAAGGFGIPSLPLRLAAAATGHPPDGRVAAVRPDWRKATRLPRVSAADLLVDGPPVCGSEPPLAPRLAGRVVLVGYTAAGLNDAKPTPVDGAMAGTAVLAEATEALVAGHSIGLPPAGFKYLLAALLSALAAYAFFRGEPHNDIDSVFVAANLLLLAIAFIGLSYFGYFFDIFAAVGFISVFFGLCRAYAKTQRGRAVGNSDYRPPFDPTRDRWLVVARVHFVPRADGDAAAVRHRRREHRRRLRRFLYAGCDAVMLEGVVEEKTWLHEALSDLVVLLWRGATEAEARRAAAHDLADLEAELAAAGAHAPEGGTVRFAYAVGEVASPAGAAAGETFAELHALIGSVLATSTDWPLARAGIARLEPDAPAGEG